ncbi:MAG: translation elongation factor Ts [Holosporaceae bacterium]|nr:translation elongation factor Ts [Holosporaceae bacterium]
MSKLNMDDVRVLRERTGSGMMDCKNALVECGGDIEGAIDWLRKKGLASAAKKSSRIAAEGLICVCVNGTSGTLVEVNAETDFVARNELFQAYVNDVAKIALEKKCDVIALRDCAYPKTGRSVADELSNLIAVVGENMNLRRVAHVSVSDGVVAVYVHNKIADNLGKIGVLVGFESKGNKAVLMDLGHKIAMHIAAANPLSITIEGLDPALVERERSVAIEQTRNMGRPENVAEKIADGRMRKFHEEVVLLEQFFVVDNKVRVKEFLEAAEKELGTPVTISKFEKFALGDGIEKQSVDFAAEVAAQLT